MKAITIIQPYAHLIALPETHPEHKRVENRTWCLPASLRGQRIAIHAGKARKYQGEPVEEVASEYGLDHREMAFGAVVCTARVVGCFYRDWERGSRLVSRWGELPEWVHTHRHSEGPYGLILTDVWPLPAPIAWTGAQGIWNFPDSELAKIVDLSPRAAALF